MLGKYKDIVLANFAGGLNTRYDANMIDDNESPDINNIVFSGRNSFGPRRGYELFGASSTSSGAIYNTYGFRDREGTWNAIRTMVSSMEYYNAQTSSWEILRHGYTPNTKFGFAYFGSLSLDDFIYFQNGIDTAWAWHPRYTSLLNGASNTSTVFYLSTDGYALSALGWLSAGSAAIGTDEFYYASLSANALSGCVRSSAAASHVAGDAIVQLPLSSYRFTYDTTPYTYNLSAMPKGNIMTTFQSRVYVAGTSTAEEVVSYSKIDNPWDFTYNSVTSAGDGGVFAFSEGAGPITALGGKDDKIIIWKEDAVRYLGFTEEDLPFQGTVIDGINLGAANSKCVQAVESDFFFASPLGAIRSLKQNDINGKLMISQVAQKIQPTLQQLNMASAAAIYFDSNWYLACATSGATYNNTVLMFDSNYSSWTRFNNINVNDWFVYQKELHYGSSNQLATYKFNQGFDDNDFGYEASWYSKKLDYGMPHELKRLRYVFIEGYITTNTTLQCDLFYNNSENPITKYIEGNADYVEVTGEAEVIGRSTFGLGTYGGQDSNESYSLYKFRVRLSYDNVDFFNMQLRFKTDTPGSIWKVNYIVPYVQSLPSEKFWTDNII